MSEKRNLVPTWKVKVGEIDVDNATFKQLADKLSAKSFFNKNWSNEDVIKYTQEAYNILISQGKTGLQSIIVNNEVIKVFIKNDGSFDSAYGIYKYGINDFR